MAWWDKYPNTDYHSLDVQYWIKKFTDMCKEWAQKYEQITTLQEALEQWQADITREWEIKYNQINTLFEELTQWKIDTTDELQTWKTSVEERLATWRESVERGLSEWEDRIDTEWADYQADTDADIASWKAGVEASLDAWKTAFITTLNQLVAQAETARDAAIQASTTAQNAADDAETARDTAIQASTTAQNAVTNAETARDAAIQASTAAQGYAHDAQMASVSATQSAVTAQNAADDAEDAAQDAADAVKDVKDNFDQFNETVNNNTIFSLSENVFNPDAPGVEFDKSYQRETGDIIDNNGYILSNYIPVKKTDSIRWMINGYDALNAPERAPGGFTNKIAAYDSEKKWIFTKDLYSNPYDTPIITLGIDGFIRITTSKNNATISLFISSTTKQNFVDLIMFMGADNMAGRGSSNTSHPDTLPSLVNGAGWEFKSISDPTGLSKIRTTYTFGKDENVSGGIDDGSSKTMGCVIPFINQYFLHNGKIPVVGVSASEGSTTINDWLPNSARLNDAINRINTAKTWLNNNGYNIRHIFMCWCQGESDGDAGTSISDYTNNFNLMLSEMKNYGVEKCFLFRIGEYNGSGSIDYTNIIQAQTDIAKTNSDVVLVTANQSSFKSRGMMKNNVNYYQDGYNEMGAFGGINAAYYVTNGKEPTMYDTKYNDLYFSHVN